MRDRTAVEAGIHAVLVQDPQIVFAYLYGSFVRGDVFQDIDIGVYVSGLDPTPHVVSADL